MPALDAFLGQNSVNGVGIVNVTTTAPAAAGARIFAYVSWFNSVASSMTVSGGGLTWSSLCQVNNGSDKFAIWSALPASGLASGQTISASQGISGQGGLLMSLASFTGLGSIDTVNTGATSTGTGWSTGTIAPAGAGGLLTGGSGNETSVTTSSTPVNGTEIAGSDNWNSAAGQGSVAHYIIPGSTGAQAATGTWSTSSTANTGILVSYLSATISSGPSSASGPGLAGMFTPQLLPNGWF